MEHPGFFERAGPFKLSDIAVATNAEIGANADPDLQIFDVLPLSDASDADLSFVDNRKYISQLSQTKAAACLVAKHLADKVPTDTAPLILSAPYHGFAQALHLYYPTAMRPQVAGDECSAFPGKSLIHPTAIVEPGAMIEPGAVVGREAVIGSGSRIAAGAVVGFRVHIGRDSFIGPGATVIHALLGNNVIIHAGVRIGQDGFGFAMGREGHLKVPQIGRVIIQDNVEIGANSCLDRGALKDTVIGEGCKIDDLVMIGHNVVLGRHCVIVSQCGIAGSSTLGDFVVMGGHAGVAGHVKVGDGAQIAGSCHAIHDVPAGARMGGTPARPFRQFARELAALKRLAKSGRAGGEK